MVNVALFYVRLVSDQESDVKKMEKGVLTFIVDSVKFTQILRE
jgi:hypothetical protein